MSSPYSQEDFPDPDFRPLKEIQRELEAGLQEEIDISTPPPDFEARRRLSLDLLCESELEETNDIEDDHGSVDKVPNEEDDDSSTGSVNSSNSTEIMKNKSEALKQVSSSYKVCKFHLKNCRIH